MPLTNYVYYEKNNLEDDAFLCYNCFNKSIKRVKKMTEFKDYKDVKESLLESGSATILFETDDELATNTHTMQAFFDLYDVSEDDIVLDDGTYAELQIEGRLFRVDASGNGDFRSHKIEIEEME